MANAWEKIPPIQSGHKWWNKKNIFGAGSCAERGRRGAMNAQIRSWGSAIDGTGEYSRV